MSLQEFRVTFPTRYAREPHPNCEWVHPDGWLTIMAPNERAARECVVDIVGRVKKDDPSSAPAYAFMYPPSEWSSDQNWNDWYPRGEICRAMYEANSGSPRSTFTSTEGRHDGS